MLLEDYLDRCEKLLEKFLSGKVDTIELIQEIKRGAELLEPEELSANEGLKDYIGKFVSYYLPLASLPNERQHLRVKNGFTMINKLRGKFLLTSFDESTSAIPVKVSSLNFDIKYAKGVGERRAKILKKLGIETVKDLLWWLPRDYEDRRRIVPLSSIVADRKVTIRAKLQNFSVKKVKEYVIISAVVSDGFGQIILKWFNQEYITDRLIKEREYLITGIPKKTPFGPYEMNSPEIEEITGRVPREILPLYSLSAGISQKVMRKIVRKNITNVRLLKEFIPAEVIKERNLLPRHHAMYTVHFPKSLYELKESRRRLAYEELFLFEVAVLYNREKLKTTKGGISKSISGKLAERFIDSLNFVLTGDQMRAFEEIREDMKAPTPMNRLLQGDVGSGKTVVAELAIIDNFEAGYQSAMMVPTTVLATQQHQKLVKDLEPLGIKVELLVGSQKKSQQEEIKKRIAIGEVDVVVGTHALIQENVKFKDLGLVVIDEQHRFGVKQREALMNKGALVDTLVMTATPIPRTLALTAYGDLDISTITEMPPGRAPIRTMLISEKRLPELYAFIRDEVNHGHQAFFIYPLIEESEQMDLKAATDEAERLQKEVFPDIGVELLHGRMSDEEKNRIMHRFKNKEAMILVSTSVVEVGIDIPTATVMVIEHPERFGLAQLHQLRGRVGRSSLKSYCMLVLNSNISGEALDRLRKFAGTQNGFKLAEIDLSLRGPGEFMGTRQHGLPDFLVADIVKDSELLIMARNDAMELLKRDPNLEKHNRIIEEIKERFGENISLIEVG